MIVTRKRIQAMYLVLALMLLASPSAMAVKVYQWTDEEGVVHFSDTPPPDGASGGLNEIVLADTGESADPDRYSIVNQLEQMMAWRQQEEENQLAWEKLRLEEERLAQEQRSAPAVVDTATDYYYPAYYPAVYYSPYRYNYYPRGYNAPYRFNNPPHMRGDVHWDGVHRPAWQGYALNAESRR